MIKKFIYTLYIISIHCIYSDICRSCVSHVIYNIFKIDLTLAFQFGVLLKKCFFPRSWRGILEATLCDKVCQ